MSTGTLIATHRHASKGTNFTIRSVWKENLLSEFQLLRQYIVTHKYVSMDVEFPGVVARPIAGAPGSTKDLTAPYETLRCNVDLLNPIQVGFSLADQDGNLPVIDGVECGGWQFNFKFSLTEDMFATESIDLLERAGVEFDFLEDHGVSHQQFGELLISSGLVLDEDVTFITFHGGYALAYLLKLMTCKDMPTNLDQFVEAINLYLPSNWDIRYCMYRNKPHWAGGSLDNLGAEFGIKRENTMAAHQAGSDAFMALKVFFAMRSAKLMSPSSEGSIYALEPRPRSAPPSPAGTGPLSSLNYANLPAASPLSTGGPELDSQTPDKNNKGFGGGFFGRRN
jgi:CCR4-NOT transcription complex subunit 7/8